MNAGEARPKAPVHLWIVGVLALLWNLGGPFDYVATQFELGFYLSQFTPEQRAYFDAYPAWMVFFWALAVWSAFAGSIGLLMRKKWAFWAFAVGCASMVMTTIYGYFLTNGAEIMGTGGVIFTIVIWVIELFLLWYSWTMAKRGVLA
jgi:hypothetical protein